MTKKLRRIRKLVTLFILVTFFLETTVVAEIQMLLSIAPVHARSAPHSDSLAVVSTAPGVPAPGPTAHPLVSATPPFAPPVAGSSVASFTTPAGSSLTGTAEDIVRLSLSSDEEQGNRESEAPSSSADGRWVAFQSRASNLVPGDTNHKIDIFVRTSSPAKPSG